MKYLLDTDHVSVLQRQSGQEYVALTTRMAAHPSADFGLSIVSFHEQVLGCHTYLVRARTSADTLRGYLVLGQVLNSFQSSPVLPFDPPAVAEFDGLVAKRVRIATMDLRIASIALSRSLVLLTRNVSDFGKVPGLKTENWTV